MEMEMEMEGMGKTVKVVNSGMEMAGKGKGLSGMAAIEGLESRGIHMVENMGEKTLRSSVYLQSLASGSHTR